MWSSPRNIVLGYLLLGVAWILFSDRVILMLADQPRLLTQLQTFKGWAFVFGTAALLQFLLRRYSDRVEAVVVEKSRAEARLRLAVESADLGLFDVDYRTRKFYYSAEWRRQLGIEADEDKDIFQQWRERVHPDDAEALTLRIEQCLAHPEHHFRATLRLRHEDGSYRWMLITAHQHVDAVGELQRLVGFHCDINELKAAEAQLAENEARQRTIVETAPVGIFLLDRDGNHIYCNRSTEEITGRFQSELDRMQWILIIDPQDREKVMQEWQATVTEKRSNFLETRIRQPNGSVRWVQIETVPTRVAGDVTGHVGMIYDLTELHQAVSDLRTSEARYRELAELSPAGIFHTDAEGEILFVSQRLQELLELSSTEITAAPWADRAHPEDRAQLLEVWEDARQAHEPIVYDYRLMRPNQGSLSVHLEARPQVHAGQGFDGYIGCVLDVSELLAAREELQHMNRELERRVAERTHELEVRNRELKRFNELFVGRELRMQELKEQLAESLKRRPD